jgi:uracil-DNA glycosylase family 4
MFSGLGTIHQGAEMNINHAMSVQSDFSIGKSLLQIDHIIEKAVEFGYESAALCDEMSLHGMIDFTNKAKKAGIRPIIGCRLRVYDDPTYRKPAKSTGEKEKPNPFYFLKVYVIDERGISSLFKLLSKALTPEYFYYHARCGLGDVLELEGVAVSTGDLFNVFHHQDCENIISRLSMKFKTFIELVPINTPLFDTLNAKAMILADKSKLPTLVTYPTLYKDPSGASTLDVLGCITSNSQMSVTYRSKQFVKDFAFAEPKRIIERSKMAMARISKWNGVIDSATWISGIRNIEVLADMCRYEFKKQEISLPKIAENEFVTLGKKCIEGWKKRLTSPVLGYMPPIELIPAYKARLEYELSVLKKMGFSGYFLLVEDLMTWAKSNEVVCGPGRGSVGGSLVAYLLGITDVDPIRFNLLFERFINPERLDLPDADLDFMSAKRHLVVEYLTKKYGADRVAGISNYSSLASASALRDTGRMFGMSGLDLMATKLVPKEHGRSFTLTESAKAVPDIEKFSDTHPHIWGHALRLEGVMRSFGQHAAGLVIAGEPLIERAVVETRSESPVVCWDKRTVEDFGLVKMDLLGLSTLDVLEIAKRYIKERHGKTVDYLKLPLEEADVFAAFGRGDTTGVFQFSSSGMKKLLRSLAESGPLTFEDITAATALYRPGPMDSGLMDDFIQIKRGDRLPRYDHPNMIPALKDTYSVIVYQEQVMRLAVDVAGFTGAEADHLRSAMGKKNKEKMAEMRQRWIDGCLVKSGIVEGKAGDLFDKIEMFAGYGFNKSHATAYSIISMWTMWLRVRYPAEYFAACMSIVKEDALPGLVNDARACGIEILPPDLNLSSDKFTIPDDKHILAPFSSVKGISENTALRIMKMRYRLGRFNDVDEFRDMAAKIGSKVNARVVENLGLVGAYASIEPGSLPARHPDRLKNQMELMPGLIVDSVKADRVTDVGEKFLRAKIIALAQEYKKCEGCSLKGQPHPTIRLGKSTVKYMVVSDCPSWQEEKKDKLLEGDAADHIKAAIKDAGLSVAEGYFTTLVKAKKSDKFLTNEQLNSCPKFLEREIELIKPAIIVALGSAAIKYLVPGIKGGTAELAGKVIYDPKRDASIVCGINAAQCLFDSSKTDILSEVFKKVADMLS